VSLALATRIPFSVWLAEDEQTVLTAFELLDEQAEELSRRGR
jgi:hypothetical protein